MVRNRTDVIIMCKYILTVILFCLCALARGQSIYEYVYWFDGDVATKRTVQITDTLKQMDIDVSALETGLHTMHMQVMDGNAVVSSPVTRIFFRFKEVDAPSGYYQIDSDGDLMDLEQVTGLDSLDVSSLPIGSHIIRYMLTDADGKISSISTNHFMRIKEVTTPSGYYQIDRDGELCAVDTVEGAYLLDVSGLKNGLHIIRYMVEDAEGKVSSVSQSHFVKIPLESEKLSYSYMFDNDTTTMSTGDFSEDVMWFDVSKLADGFHTISIFVHASYTTQHKSYYFIKIPQTEGVEYLNSMCYVDGKLFHQEQIFTSSGVVEWDVDMSSLKRGLHTIELQVASPSGTASLLRKSLFLRTVMDDALANLDCYCIIDDSLTTVVKGVYNDRHYDFDIDVSMLPDGEHSITYLLLDNSGIVTNARTATFVKSSSETGIEQLEENAHRTVIYDLSGRKVTQIVNSGVYIINGKKVMINK